ncbi:MAG: TetR/AcrR family transcriptional regulator [Bacteroidales bacterium]|nr:TetR/AcrR family transcriptional regulator [Bacteroidales bacterium]MCM1416772.1 TetR/AcrR family transcriptional regulator [bacterium]MCM1424730.1 TetR/AcrR family transcriptional regulator [bacterium]
MRKRPDITEKTKNNICTVFWQLYHDRPINRVYVTDIIKTAGINRATFYRYYHDVYEIREEKEEELIAYLKEKLIFYFDAISQVNMEDLMEEIGAFYQEQRSYLKILMGKYGDAVFSHTLKGELTNLLMEKIPATKDTVEEQMILAFARGGIMELLELWLLTENRIPVEKVCEISMYIIRQGILPSLYDL